MVPNDDEVKDFTSSKNSLVAFPYWAKVWPSSIALAAFIQRNSHLLANKKVAELAAGLALPSVVAATYAKLVWCSDLSAEAMQVAAESAASLHLKNITFEALDWNNLPRDFNAEVVLLSDINYDPAVFENLENVLIMLLNKGCTLLLATPHRLMAKPFIEKLTPYIREKHEECVKENNETTFISILVLRTTLV